MDFQEYYQAALRRGWFDPCFYFDLLQSQEISLSDPALSLFEHYATIGWGLGMSPSDRFSVKRYLDRYPEVRERQVDPLYDHLVRGRRDQREAFPLFEAPPEVRFVGLAECRSAERRTRQPPRLEQQLALAQAQGIAAFCLHYDDGELDLLDRIGPETPFCLLLDYRNWGHRYGGEGALAAQYRLIHDVLAVFADPRHLRVRGKPLLVVYRAELLEQPRLTLELWREAARGAGLGGLFVVGLPFAGTSDTCGLDGTIDAPVVPAGDGKGALHEEALLFPGFMPDRDLSPWRGCGGNAPELFRNWLSTAASQAAVLPRQGLPQLVFLDARNGWAEGAQAFLGAAGPATEGDDGPPARLRRFAQAILVSSRLPVLFLCGDQAREMLMRRLMAILKEARDLECFVVVEGNAASADGPGPASLLSLCDLEAAGWPRGRIVELLAKLLRARGDLVVVSGDRATADLLAQFAAHGHGIASFLHEPPAPDDKAIDGFAHHAQRIIVGSEPVREQIATRFAIASGDIQLVQPPADTDHKQDWTRYAGTIGTCLRGLGNEGRRIRLTGGTLGRQDIAPDLCVVVPSYNHKQFILAAVDSILAQSVRPKEIRIIDDGSDDGSADLVLSLASEELGIIVEARENRGAPATINQGIAETGCPIVAVMNSDDLWHPLRIEELIGDLRRREGADVVFSRLRFSGSETRCGPKRSWYERGLADYRSGTPLWLALMFCNFFFTTSNLIARREKILEAGGFGPLRYCHDLDYLLKATFAGHKVSFVEQTLCDYRVHDSNTIEEDVNEVLFEEAWIIVKFLQRAFGRISEVERLGVAGRIIDKGLATRVLGILRTAARCSLIFDDALIKTEPRMREIAEHGHDEAQDVIEPRELVHEMAQFILALGAGAPPEVRV